MRRFFLLFFPLFMFSSIAAAADNTMTPEDLKKNDAQFQCMQFVSKSLDEPKEAKFDYFGYFPVHAEKDGVYRVTVMFENSQGKQTMQCNIKETTPGVWTLVDITKAH